MNHPTESAIIAAGANVAPRITPNDIAAAIASEHYFIVSDALQLAGTVHVAKPEGWTLGPTQLLTICVLQLRNGFTVTGESARASPENFSAEVGRWIARENAVAKVWPLLGYELRSKLAATPSTEKAELDDKLAKLREFIETPTYEALHGDEKSRLLEQEEAMSDYSRALRDRIAAFKD